MVRLVLSILANSATGKLSCPIMNYLYRSSKMTRSCDTKVCCVKCKREISLINFNRHYDSHDRELEPTKSYPDDLKCRFCGKECKNKLAFSNHERTCPSNSNRNYKNGMTGKQGKNQFIKAKESGLPIPVSATKGKPGKCAGKKHSEETKKIISEKRKLFLQNNPNKHPWKRKDKHISIPCERVKEYLDKRNIMFIEEYQPLPDRFFSIDIAFPDIKLGIEINGNQHYDSDGTLSEYYQKRHDLIVSSGWVLIELHYSSCFTDSKLDSIFSDITDLNRIKQPDYSEYFTKREKKKLYKPLSRIELSNKIKEKTDVRWEPFKQKVLDSDIDFSKFGWVSEVADLLQIKSQKVNMWMKRYLPDFYNEYCFKRKTI